MHVRDKCTTAAIGLLIVAGGCGSDGGADAEMAAKGLARSDVRFEAFIGAEPWSCTETFMMGTPPTPAQPSHLRLFVYDVGLVGDDGAVTQLVLDRNEWQGNFSDIGHNVALLDFDDATGNCRHTDPETHKAVTGWVPKGGSYVGLSFRIGVPTELNHIDAGLAPPPMNRPGLWWAWKAGSILLRADFDTEKNSSHRPETKDDMYAPGGWQLWLAEAGYGPQACAGDVDQGYSCPNRFQPKVSLPVFDAKSDRVRLDLGALLKDVDMNRSQWDPWPNGKDPEITDPTITPYVMPDFYAGCFMDRVDGECAAILPHLGVDWVKLSLPDPGIQNFAAMMQ